MSSESGSGPRLIAQWPVFVEIDRFQGHGPRRQSFCDGSVGREIGVAHHRSHVVAYVPVVQGTDMFVDVGDMRQYFHA